MTAQPASLYQASDGAAYERFIGRWSRRLAGPFLDFARVPPGGDVLDVGCGTGSLTHALAAGRAKGSVLGIDIAAPYVAFAGDNGGAGGAGFAVADARCIPCSSGRFSGVLAQLVLNFFPEPAAAVAEMRRVARPDGVVAACVWDFRGGLTYQRLFWDSAAAIDPAAGRARDRLFANPLAGPDGLIALWRDAGLDDVTATSLTVRMDYANFADYWEPLLGGQGPVGVSYVQTLGPQRHARIRDTVRDAYLAGGSDGPRSMTATAWAVRGLRLVTSAAKGKTRRAEPLPSFRPGDIVT